MCDMFPFIEELEKMMAMIAQIEEREKGFSGAVMFLPKSENGKDRQHPEHDNGEQQKSPSL